jgi:hypothetical protein
VQVPRTSSKRSDGLFYKKQLQQSEAAKARILARKEELSSMSSAGGAAFSFYERDLEQREARAQRLEAHRNNKNRFQVPALLPQAPSEASCVVVALPHAACAPGGRHKCMRVSSTASALMACMHVLQVKFKAKQVPAHVKEQRLLGLLEATEKRKEAAREQAQRKLAAINEEFAAKQGRVAGAQQAAMQPFVGTVEDNIMCTHSLHVCTLAASMRPRARLP